MNSKTTTLVKVNKFAELDMSYNSIESHGMELYPKLRSFICIIKKIPKEVWEIVTQEFEKKEYSNELYMGFKLKCEDHIIKGNYFFDGVFEIHGIQW